MSTIPVVINISKDRISDLIIGAVEGGSNYWATIRIEDAKGFRVAGLAKFADLKDGICGKCRITFSDREWEEPTRTIDLTTPNLSDVMGGLQVMAEKFPQHFANFLAENDDAETADVFVQCCCFGEVLFG